MQANNNDKSSPKSFGKSRFATLHGREWTHPLQTSPVTQPLIRYVHTAVPHSYYTLHCTFSCPTPEKIPPFC